ncbi:MAG: hydrogenase maturation nickel metallochaperone HypA [Alphaproteobacteria bacterium]|nr:hydrogenase maturation nickel metallochaperone HypA [Alphaproteobacteria bacterium]
MHELSICLSLLREVERAARGRSVTEITLAVGPLSGVEPQQLKRAFAVARAGTIAKDAELICRMRPVCFACSACGQEVEAPLDALSCPSCGDWQVRLRSGDKLLLESVTLADGVEKANL